MFSRRTLTQLNGTRAFDCLVIHKKCQDHPDGIARTVAGLLCVILRECDGTTSWSFARGPFNYRFVGADITESLKLKVNQGI